MVLCTAVAMSRLQRCPLNWAFRPLRPVERDWKGQVLQTACWVTVVKRQDCVCLLSSVHDTTYCELNRVPINYNSAPSVGRMRAFHRHPLSIMQIWYNCSTSTTLRSDTRLLYTIQSELYYSQMLELEYNLTLFDIYNVRHYARHRLVGIHPVCNQVQLFIESWR